MRMFLAVAVLLGGSGVLGQAQSGLELIQPDAGFVLGIEWRKIVDSSIGTTLTEQIKKTPLPPMPAATALLDALLHDLDSVVLAASATELDKTAAAQPPALVILKGRFKPELRSQLKGLAKKSETYRSVELLIAPDDTPAANKNRIAFLGENTVVGGDVGEVRAAIDRFKGGRLTAAHGGIRDGIADLASKNDLWIVFELPANALKEAPPAAVQMFSGVKSAEMGMSFQQGFALQMNVRTKDDASATAVAQALQGLIALGAMSQSDSPQAGEVLKKIRITPENSRVKLALSLDRSELEKMIKEAQSGSASAPKKTAARTPAPTRAPARAPEPAGPKTVRITGLDSGPVEVPFTPSQK
jgi:ribosomal protein L12E/L44/L45/RPP1/RPP2